MPAPTELDRLDPPPRPPRTPRRRKGDMEKGVAEDLGKMPPELRKSAVAAGSLLLARQLDEGAAIPREAAGHLRKLARLLFDDELTGQGAAPLLLQLASNIEDGLSARDTAGYVAQIRMNTARLREWNTGAGQQPGATGKAREKVGNAPYLRPVG